ncbi:MAG: carbohydrate binding family 9 domain-containing protein [Flavobacteriales bacterium]|nr:carbohydrate binding family 9 domain-containing protein [Flavobacteriales bacterium]
MRLLALATLIAPGIGLAQDTTLVCKNLTAARAVERIVVDGVLNEPSWTTAATGTEFVQNEPRPNEPANFDSKVRVLYDDDALYVGALLFDPRPDSVMMRLSGRDQIGITDWFGIAIDPYESGRNGFEFIVTAAGVQFDAIVANEEEDENWHAVWQSATRIVENGWQVEMRIPYSAFRFPTRQEHVWSMQFLRLVGRTREKSFWNPIDPLKEGWLRQCGVLTGISGIQAPLRLMLYPYVSAYAQHYPSSDPDARDWTSTFNGGMDVKLGLSDAYTLDMTLIPDFGQVVSDNVVLNLSPFEVQFNENRQFFTEGTELFQRGGLFYSRRIGGVPLLRGDLYADLNDGDRIVEDPGVSKLLNATKISGRGRKGLGIGVLNAVTRAAYGTIADSTGAEREVLTDPLTNYNVIVADQQLPNNGYVSLINTNVTRDGATYDANSSAIDFVVNNKGRSLQGSGVARISQRYGESIDSRPGYSYTAGLRKTGGALTYGAEYNEVSPRFNPNDLGYWVFTNYRGVEPFISYTKYKPRSPWQRWGATFAGEYLRVVVPDHFFNFALELNTFRIMRGFNAFGGSVRAEPVLTYDPFEARVPGRLYEFPTNVQYVAWISTNYNLPYAVDLRAGFRRFHERDRKNLWALLEQRFRPNDKLFFILSGYHEFKDEDVGWVAFHNEDIILGRRDQWTTEIGLEGSYTFTNKISINADVRHYWSRAHYVEYHDLLEDGQIAATDYTGLHDDGTSRHDVDFDAFTVDLWLRWNFAPGSELTLGWKDNIFARESHVRENYLENLRNTWAAPGINSFSLKVIWFVDAGRWIKRRKD